MFGYCGSAMGVGGWAMMIALWGGVVAIAVWALTRVFPTESRADRRVEALELLERRLAAGEIDPATYRQTLDELVAGRR